MVTSFRKGEKLTQDKALINYNSRNGIANQFYQKETVYATVNKPQGAATRIQQIQHADRLYGLSCEHSLQPDEQGNGE